MRGRSTLDLVGSALVAVALTGISYAIVEVRERGLDAVLPFLVAGLAALAGLVVWTLRARDPVVPPSLLRVPGLASANLVTLVMYAALGAHLLFLPVYLQFLGFSPTLAGLVFVPPSIGLILLAPRFGRYADRNGPRVPIAFGAATIGTAVLLLLPATTRAEAWTWGARERLPLRGRPARGRGADHGGRAVTCSRGPRGRRRGAEPDRRAGGRHPLGRRDRRARRRPSSPTGGGTGDTPFDPSAAGAVRDAGIDAFHAVVLCIASLAFLASVARGRLPAWPGSEQDALEREQRHLALESAAVADEAAVRADDAVAGEHDRDRVAVHRSCPPRGRPSGCPPAPRARSTSPSGRTGCGRARRARARVNGVTSAQVDREVEAVAASLEVLVELAPHRVDLPRRAEDAAARRRGESHSTCSSTSGSNEMRRMPRSLAATSSGPSGLSTRS